MYLRCVNITFDDAVKIKAQFDNLVGKEFTSTEGKVVFVHDIAILPVTGGYLEFAKLKYKNPAVFKKWAMANKDRKVRLFFVIDDARSRFTEFEFEKQEGYVALEEQIA